MNDDFKPADRNCSGSILPARNGKEPIICWAILNNSKSIRRLLTEYAQSGISINCYIKRFVGRTNNMRWLFNRKVNNCLNVKRVYLIFVAICKILISKNSLNKSRYLAEGNLQLRCFFEFEKCFKGGNICV